LDGLNKSVHPIGCRTEELEDKSGKNDFKKSYRTLYGRAVGGEAVNRY